MRPLDDAGRATLAALRQRIQVALVVEHFTVPPYLYALLSLDEATNPRAAATLRLVLMEEMLHMALVANLLNAIGGAPDLLAPGFVQRYPCAPPHSAGTPVLGLRPLTPESLDAFLRMERPCPFDASTVEGFRALGQVYSVILGRLAALAEKYGEAAVFSGDPARQLTAEHYYGGRGALRPIADYASAEEAFETIVAQGEGAAWWGEAPRVTGDDDPTLGHHQRFLSLALGRRWAPGDRLDGDPTGPPDPVDWGAVTPLVSDPRAQDYAPGSDARAALDACNASYRALLAALHRAFNGEPAAMGEAVPAMYALRRRAEALRHLPLPHANGARLGPSFEV